MSVAHARGGGRFFAWALPFVSKMKVVLRINATCILAPTRELLWREDDGRAQARAIPLYFSGYVNLFTCLSFTLFSLPPSTLPLVALGLQIDDGEGHGTRAWSSGVRGG